MLTGNGFTLPTQGLKNGRKGFKAEPKRKLHGSVLLEACDNIGHNTSRLAILLAKPKRKYVELLSPSKELAILFSHILMALDCEAAPLFYHFLTDQQLMKALMIVRYPVMQLGTEDTHAYLDTEEYVIDICPWDELLSVLLVNTDGGVV